MLIVFVINMVLSEIYWQTNQPTFTLFPNQKLLTILLTHTFMYQIMSYTDKICWPLAVCWSVFAAGDIPQRQANLSEINHDVYSPMYQIKQCVSLQWRHDGRDGVSNHQPHDCLLNRLFRRRSKKTSKLCVTGLCAGNPPLTGEFPAWIASNAENVSIWRRHHVYMWQNHTRERCRNRHRRHEFFFDKNPVWYLWCVWFKTILKDPTCRKGPVSTLFDVILVYQAIC